MSLARGDAGQRSPLRARRDPRAGDPRWLGLERRGPQRPAWGVRRSCTSLRRGPAVPGRFRLEWQADRRRYPPHQRELPARMNRFLSFATAVALAAPAGAQQITPPQPVETPPAVAPEGGNQAATVVLLVTVGADGTAREVSVAQSASPALDAAAVAAVLRWKFKPALRDGQPFEARVRIPFRFEAAAPPVPSPQGAAQVPVPGAAPTQPATPQPPPPPPTAAGGERIEVNVRGYQRKVEHGASDFVIDIGQLAVVPRKTAQN